MQKLRIFNVFWTSQTAGPSPDDNKRTEIFLAGCNKALFGEPCENCFNPDLWNKDCIARVTPLEMVRQIEKFSPNRFITFVGGEPLDQFVPLTEVCKQLKVLDYHILVFTHFSIEEIFKLEKPSIVKEFFDSVDILIDGTYNKNEHIYNDDFEDGFHNAVGSGNQIVWDVRDKKNGIINGIAARDIVGLYITNSLQLKYVTRENVSWISSLAA